MKTINTPSNTQMAAYYWRHATRYPRLLISALVTAPLALLFNEFLPALIISGILNRLASGDFVRGDVWGSFGPQILLAVGLAALGGTVLWRVHQYFAWTLEGFVVKNINLEAFDHLMHMSTAFHSNSFGGSLVSQTNKLAFSYVRLADTTLYNTGNLFWALVFSNVLLITRAPLFVILLDVVSVVFIVSAFWVTREAQRRGVIHAEADNRQTGQLADSITNVMAIKSFAGEPGENKRYHKASEVERIARMGVMRAVMKSMTFFSVTTMSLNTVAIVAAVVSVVVYNANVATVFLVFAFTAQIRNGLWDFGNTALRNYNRAFGDAQAMMKVLGTPLGIEDSEHPEKSTIHRGQIAFESVNFHYTEQADHAPLFKNLNLTIKPGEKIGLVGHSGGGKTTVTKLLLRFMDIQSGAIRIDGQDIAAIAQKDLRAHIAYVPQEPLLFHRSLAENISYGRPDATQKEIEAVAKMAHAHEFIQLLPDGYKTLVGERGVKLSGGQRQRVAIARAMLKNAPILVLDEATSALDSESEVLIQDALWKLMQDRTAIVIAHRLSTIQKMDRIVVLDEGNIVEQGTHKELVRSKGVYASLWAHQSGGFIDE